jgi:hypothetical protein
MDKSWAVHHTRRDETFSGRSRGAALKMPI